MVQVQLICINVSLFMVCLSGWIHFDSEFFTSTLKVYSLSYDISVITDNVIS